ncbi:MAG: glycerol kinase [Gammaproteobacteria bacterium]|nr:glycerol kinase [Gammaproteobacteria bacterium]
MKTSATRPDALYLALDQGGHASRALVFDHPGNLVASDFQPITTRHPQPDWVEHDPQALIASLRRAIANVMRGLGSRAQDVVAAGLATQRSSLACWDKNSGAALSPVISWQDRRAHDWLEAFARHRDEIHRITGLFPSAHHGASKLRWCLDHLPAVQAARQDGTLICGPLASFILFHLLEERPILADPANAARTLLWNLQTRDWDDELLTLFGVPRAALPRCVASRHLFGHLRTEGQVIPLTLTTGDQSAALFAFGHPDAETAYVNMGTGAFVQRIALQRPSCPRLLNSVVFAEKERAVHALEGTVNGAASALDWAARELGLEDVAPHLPRWLDEAETPPLFLNGVSGLGSPFWLPGFASRFIGNGEPWEKMVAVAESIVFLLYTNLVELQTSRAPLQKIVVSGGLSALDGLCQRLADLSGLPVHRPAECEATARGTAFLLAGQPRTWPEPGTTAKFTPTTNPSLAERFQRWQASMPSHNV